MEREKVISLFEEFSSKYDVERHQAIWNSQSNIFKQFWKDKILNNLTPDPDGGEYDAIIRIIDVNGRGFNRQLNEAVARVNLTQGTWYRIFNDLRQKNEIKIILDKIFKTDEERVLVEMINRLKDKNDSNKNGLTGERATGLNALLFINNPDKYISSVSLNHRLKIVEMFGFGDPNRYKTYGEKVIGTNKDIIEGFKNKFGISAWPRLISRFLYDVGEIKSFWDAGGSIEELPKTEETANEKVSEKEFLLERHLEDFLIANWENTELGKNYELIEENDELKSQQYRTDIGPIDLLVREKRTKEYTVIELKKGLTSDDAIGQLTRYMGWVKKNLSRDKKVNGILISHEDDIRVRYATSVIPNVEFFIYHVDFKLESIKKYNEDKGHK